MDKQEFLFLIPGVIYGVAIFDLLSLFRSKKMYWESIFWALLLFFSIVVIMFDLFNMLKFVTSNILVYTIYLLSPIFYAQACFLLTPPEESIDMKDYFFSKRKGFFLALTGVTFINLAVRSLAGIEANLILNALALLAFFLTAFINKLYYRLFAAALIIYWIFMKYIAFF